MATRTLPAPFGEHLAEVLAATGKMRDAAKAIGVDRKFTPDGRFVGDIGELIAKVHFGLKLHGAQKKGEDAICEVSGRTVEVKLRSNSSLIWVKTIPDILLVLFLSPATHRWGVVCNGPGRALLTDGEWDDKHQRFQTSLSRLLDRQRALNPAQTGISEIPSCPSPQTATL